MRKAEEIFNEQDKQYKHMFDDILEYKVIGINSIKEAQIEAWNEAIEKAANLVKGSMIKYGSISDSVILTLKK